MLNCIVVGLGGFLGSVARYLVGMIPIREEGLFPVNTFIINILGAFALGCIAVAVSKGDQVDPRLALFLKVGVCGGFTTFSTFSLETGSLIQGGHPALGAAYAVASILFGVLAALAGQMLVK